MVLSDETLLLIVELFHLRRFEIVILSRRRASFDAVSMLNSVLQIRTGHAAVHGARSAIDLDS